MPRPVPPFQNSGLIWALVAVLGVFGPPAAELRTEEPDLNRKVEILAAELASLREQLTVPETDEQIPQARGLGPAAAKVYGVQQGLSIGGYGEFYFGAPVEEKAASGARNTADFYRFVAYIGYKFSDSILLNTELEWEHGGSEVSVEFSYLDFLISPAFSIRAGSVLVPMGITNQRHEPTVYRGNFRPEIERRIIPTTWGEMGVGAYGSLGGVAHYSAYVLNGFDAAGFGAEGVRGGRQKAQEATFEDIGGVLALEFSGGDDAWNLGASAYYGQADQGRFTDASGALIEVTNRIAEAHLRLHHRGLEVRALYVTSDLDGVRALLDSPEWSGSAVVPTAQEGWYVEAAYDLAPTLWGREDLQLSPWLRYESFDLQERVPSGLVADDALAQGRLSLGLEFRPDHQVVLKAEYVHKSHDASSALSDEIRVGAGFIY